MNAEDRFDVFGHHMAVARSRHRWRNEGKRRLTPATLPDSVAEPGLAGYQADLYHASATPLHGEVRRLP